MDKKIFKIIYSKYTIFVSLVSSFFLLFLDFPVISIAMSTLLIIWILLIMLSANKKCLKLIILSFEWWLKLFYSVQWVAASTIRIIHFGGLTSYLDVFVWIWSILPVISFVVLFSSMDALRFTLWTKRIICILFISFFTLLAILWNFLENYSHSNYEIYITEDISVSTLSLERSSSQILAIFFWKQMILSIIRKDRCVLIKYTPYHKWIDVENNGENVGNHVSINTIDDLNFNGDEEDAEVQITEIDSAAIGTTYNRHDTVSDSDDLIDDENDDRLYPKYAT